jgi:hypothetical protein
MTQGSVQRTLKERKVTRDKGRQKRNEKMKKEERTGQITRVGGRGTTVRKKAQGSRDKAQWTKEKRKGNIKD